MVFSGMQHSSGWVIDDIYYRTRNIILGEITLFGNSTLLGLLTLVAFITLSHSQLYFGQITPASCTWK